MIALLNSLNHVLTLFMIAIFIYGAYKLGDKAYNYFSDNKIKITRKNGKNNS